MRLNVNTASQSADALKKASAAKAADLETIDDAWTRIFTQKNSDADLRKLKAVKAAFEAGKIGREVSAGKPKRFSKAEAIRLYAQLAEQEREQKLADLVESTPANYHMINTPLLVERVIADINAAEYVGFDCETYDGGNGGSALDPWTGELAGFSVSANGNNYYIPIAHVEGPNLPYDSYMAIFKALQSAKLIMHNAPFDCKWVSVKLGVNLADALHADTRIMAMALDENRDHRLKNLLTDWLKEPSDNFDQIFGKTPFNTISLDVALVYAAGDTEKTLKLFDWMMKHLNTEKLTPIKRLIFDIEMPVQRVFIKSDLRGIRFDVKAAAELDEKLAQEERELERKIFELAGEELNLNSPAQVKRLFFEKLGLTDYGNGSTNSRFIKKIQKEHPIVPLYSEYKEIGKLRSAFTQKLPRDVKYDGKIHPWHNTLGAATGRFTCKDPNTQQIPAKRPEIRHLFKATSEDRILVSMDFSQIELRVVAHVANDEVLIQAFLNGQDIHSTTAALISAGEFTYEDIEKFKDTPGHPCQKLRKQAKIVNFGIVYGMSANALADNLSITKQEAQTVIDNYFAGYPGIKRYMDDQHRLVRKNGFVTDMFGRKRRLHREIKSREFRDKASAERMAGNFPIQSSAGGILKKAVIDMQDILEKHDVYILLQVHDEAVYDCPRNISREALYEIRSAMENAVEMKMPVRCDIEIYPECWQKAVSEEEFFGKTNTVD